MATTTNDQLLDAYEAALLRAFSLRGLPPVESEEEPGKLARNPRMLAAFADSAQARATVLEAMQSGDDDDVDRLGGGLVPCR